VFDRASGAEIRAVQSGEPFPNNALSFSPKAHLLAWAGGTRLGLLDYDSGQTNFVPLPGRIGFCNPVFSPDGRQLAFADSGHIQLMELATRTSHAFASIDSSALVLAFSPDARSLASGHYDGSVKLWDIANRRLLKSVPKAHTPWATEVKFSPDGQL